jgi:hypothetical protein
MYPHSNLKGFLEAKVKAYRLQESPKEIKIGVEEYIN